MNAVDQLRSWADEYARQIDAVRREVVTMEQASDLRRKWGERSTQDAILREAKSRAIREGAWSR